MRSGLRLQQLIIFFSAVLAGMLSECWSVQLQRVKVEVGAGEKVKPSKVLAADCLICSLGTGQADVKLVLKQRRLREVEMNVCGRM